MRALVAWEMGKKGQHGNVGVLFSKVSLLNFQKTACSVVLSDNYKIFR